MTDPTTQERPEAWEVVFCLGDKFIGVRVPGEQSLVYFDTRQEAERFARTPIVQWERDRAVELLREAKGSFCAEAWQNIREFLEQVEGGAR